MIRNCVKINKFYNKRLLSTLPEATTKVCCNHKTQRFILIILELLQCPHVEESSSNISWENAKPLNEMPGPKSYPIVGLLPHFIPGGKYSNLPLIDINRKMREEYGKIVFFPGSFGLKNIVRYKIVINQFLLSFTYLILQVATFDAHDYEKVYRNEGVWPERLGMECFTYFRKNVRPEIFKGVGGLLAE